MLLNQKFYPTHVRNQFPSLSIDSGGRQAVFFDNPGGAQVPQTVIDAVSNYYRTSNANVGGEFLSSERTDEIVNCARQAMADLLNAPEPENIVFGQNMTSLTFHLARSIAKTIRPGDEVVVTNLDHDANVAPWLDLADHGAVIKDVDILTEDCTLDMESFQSALSETTKLVAISHASNAVGTIPDVSELIRLAHDAGAKVFVDAVQYAPHGLIDVQALDCDFLVCSAYKFFGPHAGMLYGKREHLEGLKPHKVRPATNNIPGRWETGTQNHEGMAGTLAAVDYLASITNTEGSRRKKLEASMNAIMNYERSLAERLLSGLSRIKGLRVYGICDQTRLEERLPTVAFTWDRMSPHDTAKYLASKGIFCWSGNYYALRLMERLGLEVEGGAVRIGLAHYNTVEEVDYLLETLDEAPIGLSGWE